MSSAFFDTLIPSIANSAAQAGTGYLEGQVQGPMLAAELANKQANTQWLQAHAAGYGQQHNAKMQALRNVQEGFKANPNYHLTPEGRANLYIAGGFDPETQDALKFQRMQHGGLYGAQTQEVAPTAQARRELLAGRLQQALKAGDLSAARQILAEEEAATVRETRQPRIELLGAQGEAARQAAGRSAAQTATIEATRQPTVANIEAGTALKESRKQTEEATREPKVNLLTEQSNLQKSRQGTESVIQDLRRRQAEESERRAEKLKQQMEQAGGLDPLLRQRLQAQIETEKARAKELRARTGKQQAATADKNAPVTKIAPDFTGKPQVSRTYKGPDSEMFNKVYMRSLGYLKGLKDIPGTGMFGYGEGAKSRLEQAQEQYEKLKADPKWNEVMDNAWNQAMREVMGK